MLIEDVIHKIKPLDHTVEQAAQRHFDNLIKPVGSLGGLEKMICLYAAAKGKYNPAELNYPKRTILVWGIEGSSTLEKRIYNASPVQILSEAAAGDIMFSYVTKENMQLSKAVEQGMLAVEALANEGCALLAPVTPGCYTLPSDWEHCKNENGWEILNRKNDTICAAMVGSILAGAAYRLPVLLDGLASVLAAYIAGLICPVALQYCICSQVTTEQGQEALTKEMGFVPLIRLNIAEGNGYGAALAFTLFDAGLRAYKEMETFAEAGVHDEVPEFTNRKEQKRKE